MVCHKIIRTMCNIEKTIQNGINYHTNWNMTAGCNLSDIFSELKELYPNCQMYFDVYGNFCFDLIPSCEYDPILLDNTFLQSILLSDNSESVTYNIQDIKNITEVFGAVYDVDRYSDTCTFSNNIYNIELKDYEKYFSGDIIAFIPQNTNTTNTKIKINGLDEIPLYYEYTESYIESNLFEVGKTYVFEIKRVKGIYVAYYMGQYQPHALCILTNDENDTVYTKSYFSKKYNCDERNITLRVEKESPFSVQKIGEILDVKIGNEFENIISDSVALENAIYFNRKTSSINDVVSITTKLIPFLDVNIKIEYKKQQGTESNYYVVKSISNDLESLTSNITMYRFHPLYYI